jgi:hypothetical protein
LCAIIGIPRPHAVGYLELLWNSAYESGDPRLGDSIDVELACDWDGKPGDLTKALLTCGGDGRSGFVDQDDDGTYFIHDLWDHAPEYVQKRAKREAERRSKGKNISDIRREAAKKRWAKHANGMQTADTCIPENANEFRLHANVCKRHANGATPTPAPTPAPTPKSKKSPKSPKINGEITKTAERYLEIFNAVFDRRSKSLSIITPRIAQRLSEGVYKPWQIVINPILQSAHDHGVKNLNNFGPEMLLRDGQHKRTGANGQTHGATDWLERIYSVADNLRLDRRLTEIARHYGVLEDIKRTGCAVVEDK